MKLRKSIWVICGLALMAMSGSSNLALAQAAPGPICATMVPQFDSDVRYWAFDGPGGRRSIDFFVFSGSIGSFMMYADNGFFSGGFWTFKRKADSKQQVAYIFPISGLSSTLTDNEKNELGKKNVRVMVDGKVLRVQTFWYKVYPDYNEVDLSVAAEVKTGETIVINFYASIEACPTAEPDGGYGAY